MGNRRAAALLRHAACAAAIAVLAGSLPASAQSSDGQSSAAPAPQPASIDRNAVLVLIRTAILALDQANSTGNYTVLRDLAAPGFRDANDAAKLAVIFTNLRSMNLDLSGVAVLEPQLTRLPQIEPNGMMNMAGFFPSVPAQVNFELLFAPVEGRWKIFGISVNVASSSPAAPTPQAAPADSKGSPAPTRHPAAPKSRDVKP